MSRFRFMIIAAATVAVCAVAPSLASAATCPAGSDAWTGSTGGSWTTATNWSTGAVPTSTTDVCLDNSHVVGAYTVVLNTPGQTANSITVGGTGDTITLAIYGGGALTLTNASAGGGIASTGAVTLGSSASTTPGTINISSGTLVNSGSIGAAYGTINAASGATFTNDGSLVFTNTPFGPDAIDGAFVNNATVSVGGDDAVNGTSAIVNDGTFNMSAAATFGASSYRQGSTGTLSIGITGGGAPMCPLLNLTGPADLAGNLAVTTTGGVATGTCSVIIDGGRSGTFATTNFSGEAYNVTYTIADVHLTGPATPVTPPQKGTNSTLHVKKISGGRGKITLKLSCSGGSRSCKAVMVADVTEHLKGKDVVAVTASNRKTAAVARKTIEVSPNATTTVTLKVNGTGRHLLSKFGKFKTAVTVANASGNKVKTTTVTVKPKAKKKK